MRILYVHANFSTHKGSWSTRPYDFARRWIEQGHHVSVVTGVYDRSDLRPTHLVWTGEIDGITVHALNFPFSNRDGFARRLLTSLAFSAFASWRAASRAYDVALVSCGPITIGLAALVARWIGRRTVVLEVRDLFSDALEQLGVVTSPGALAAVRRCEDVCYRSADTVVALSDTMADWIARRHRLGRIPVVPNAANVDLFGRRCSRPAELSGKAANFLYAGTLGMANDCGQLLRAARHLQEWGKSDIHLHLVGDGRERPALQAEARRTGLDQVHFVPPMPKEDLAAWLTGATAVILVAKPVPVWDTGSPNKLFDALAAGVPVIQTTQGWIRQLLAVHDCGMTVERDRPAALASAMVDLSEDPRRRDRMAANARRVARELFATDLLADRMLETLTAAHRRRRGPSGD